MDSSDARILVADSTEDGSEDGMTVEKCVAFASDGAWKYAGVEFGRSVHNVKLFLVCPPLTALVNASLATLYMGKTNTQTVTATRPVLGTSLRSVATAAESKSTKTLHGAIPHWKS